MSSSESPQVELPDLTPEHVEDVIHAVHQISDAELMGWNPTELITIITELPKSDFLLKKAYIELLSRLYILQKEKPAITAVSLTVLERLSRAFGWTKPEVKQQWERTFSYQENREAVTVTITRVSERKLKFEPSSISGGWGSITIPFRPDYDIEALQWIFEHLPKSLGKTFAQRVAYRKGQVDDGGKDFEVLKAIQEVLFQNT